MNLNAPDVTDWSDISRNNHELMFMSRKTAYFLGITQDKAGLWSISMSKGEPDK